jgi:hypothetical protein
MRYGIVVNPDIRSSNGQLEGLIPSDFSFLAEDQFLQGFRAGESPNPGDLAQGPKASWDRFETHCESL